MASAAAWAWGSASASWARSLPTRPTARARPTRRMFMPRPAPPARPPRMGMIRAACAPSTSAPSSGTPAFTRRLPAKSEFARICASASRSKGAECGPGHPSWMARFFPVALEKVVRVDIDREAHIAGQLLQAFEPQAQIALQVEFARRLDEQPPAVASADDRERRLGRPQHFDAVRARGGVRELAGEECGELLVARRDDERREPAIGRQQRRLALTDLPFEELIAVARDNGLHHGMFRQVGLDEAASAGENAPGAPRHLMQQLKGPLG